MNDQTENTSATSNNLRAIKKLAILLAVLLVLTALYDYTLEKERDKVGSLIDDEVMSETIPQNIESVESFDIQHPVPALIPQEAQQATNEDQQSSSATETAAGVELPFDPAAPLPVLYDSDETFLEVLAKILDPKLISSFFNTNAFISRFVITVDNMFQKSLPYKHMVVKTIPGTFKIKTNSDNTIYLGPENFKRYQSFMDLLEQVDVNTFMPVYIYFYPLFQEAYAELGYPNRYFNDRLIEVIDHLLETPEVKGLIKLTRPNVLYQYADPELEALSAGQKILIRIGYDNSKKFRTKLKQLKEALLDLSSRTNP